MRLAVKKRIIFFSVAILVYVSGFQWIPQTFNYDGSIISLLPTVAAAFAYFVFVPFLYWHLVIRAGQQNGWRILLIFSLSALCARYSFPHAIAQYFELIMWVKYPLMAILLGVELLILISIVRGLWQARHLTGDPRIHMLNQYLNDEKKLAVALTMAWEPASWYYALPRLSKNHINSIGSLDLRSASKYYWLTLTGVCLASSWLSYEVLKNWNEIVAITLSSIVAYGVLFITANYRVSRYHSLYIVENQLVINDSFWSFMVIDIAKITRVEILREQSIGNESLIIGKAKNPGIVLFLSEDTVYYAALGMLPEKVNQVVLKTKHPEPIAKAISGEL